MRVTFLGTGDVRQVPVFGCDCPSCQRARKAPRYQRGPCSALLHYEGKSVLLDAGQPDLEKRFQPGELAAVLLTHYHMDHVQGLFPLRWGVGPSLPVFGPADKIGCDDLFKHPGMLAFQPPMAPFIPVDFGSLKVTPLPLNHSKPTFGYYLQYGSRSLAWLCDTEGLPAESQRFLSEQSITHLVLDCNFPPSEPAARNHNDVTQALTITKALAPQQCWLTHIGHTVDNWLMDNALPAGVSAAHDGMELIL